MDDFIANLWYSSNEKILFPMIELLLLWTCGTDQRHTVVGLEGEEVHGLVPHDVDGDLALHPDGERDLRRTPEKPRLRPKSRPKALLRGGGCPTSSFSGCREDDLSDRLATSSYVVPSQIPIFYVTHHLRRTFLMFVLSCGTASFPDPDPDPRRFWGVRNVQPPAAKERLMVGKRRMADPALNRVWTTPLLTYPSGPDIFIR